MNNIALIPARGGSKTVEKKNIRLLNGLPLVAYTIKTALQNPRIRKVIVSTEDQEIAGIAKAHGAEVPFLRPLELAMDSTPDKPVIQHTLDWLKINLDIEPDLLVYLRPTSPFKTNQLIHECIDKINNNKQFTSLRTVDLAEGTNHPYWMFRSENDELKPFVEGVKISKYYQRQLLPECFKLNGVVDILRPKVLSVSNNMYGDNIGFVKINPLNAVDIDDEMDFSFAEFLMKEKGIL